MEEHIEGLRSKEDFIVFMKVLQNRLKNDDDWENKSLSDYLEAIQRWVEDMDGYYANMNKAIPENCDWKVMAEILHAASMYE